MKMKFITRTLLTLFAASSLGWGSSARVSAQPVPALENDGFSLSGGNWKIAPQAETAEPGEQISKSGFRSGTWVTAQVPGTVFGSYVTAGLE